MLGTQQLRALAIAALQAALPGVAVLRQSDRPVGTDIAQAINVRVGRTRGNAYLMGGAAPVDCTSQLLIDCVARAAPGQAADEAVAPLLLAGHAALMTAGSLLAAGFQVQPDFDLDEDQESLDARIGSATLVLGVRWRTANSNTLEP